MRLLRVEEVEERTGMSRVTIWRKEKNGEFPERRKITDHMVGWLESEVDEWIESRPVANDKEDSHENQ